MRKEVATTEDAFYCDICGEQIHDAHWAYGGYASASEETERCFVCQRDTCPNCREHISLLKGEDSFNSSRTVCKECLILNTDRIKQIEQNKGKYYSAATELRKEYLEKEKQLNNFASAVGG